LERAGELEVSACKKWLRFTKWRHLFQLSWMRVVIVVRCAEFRGVSIGTKCCRKMRSYHRGWPPSSLPMAFLAVQIWLGDGLTYWQDLSGSKATSLLHY
jgi:hypothetical protein